MKVKKSRVIIATITLVLILLTVFYFFNSKPDVLEVVYEEPLVKEFVNLVDEERNKEDYSRSS